MDILEKFVDLPSGFKVFTRYKESNHAKWLIVTHGIAEHSGRYNFIFDELSHKYNILTYDLRSHGKSSGKKGNIQNFSIFKNDLNEILKYLKLTFSMKEFSLFGHSMGALIVADYIQSHKILKGNVLEPGFYPEKVVLTSPPMAPGGSLGKIVQKIPDFIMKKLSELPYGLALGDMLDKKDLSHNLSVGDQYLSDPLVLKKLNSRFLLGLIQRAREVFSNPLNAQCPVHCIVGEADQIVDPRPLIHYSKFIDPKLELVVIPEARHELHNEVDRFYGQYKKFLHQCL